MQLKQLLQLVLELLVLVYFFLIMLSNECYKFAFLALVLAKKCNYLA